MQARHAVTSKVCGVKLIPMPKPTNALMLLEQLGMHVQITNISVPPILWNLYDIAWRVSKSH